MVTYERAIEKAQGERSNLSHTTVTIFFEEQTGYIGLVKINNNTISLNQLHALTNPPHSSRHDDMLRSFSPPSDCLVHQYVTLRINSSGDSVIFSLRCGTPTNTAVKGVASGGKRSLHLFPCQAIPRQLEENNEQYTFSKLKDRHKLPDIELYNFLKIRTALTKADFGKQVPQSSSTWLTSLK